MAEPGVAEAGGAGGNSLPPVSTLTQTLTEQDRKTGWDYLKFSIMGTKLFLFNLLKYRNNFKNRLVAAFFFPLGLRGTAWHPGNFTSEYMY